MNANKKPPKRTSFYEMSKHELGKAYLKALLNLPLRKKPRVVDLNEFRAAKEKKTKEKPKY